MKIWYIPIIALGFVNTALYPVVGFSIFSAVMSEPIPPAIIQFPHSPSASTRAVKPSPRSISPTSATSISDRTWLIIAKNPSNHLYERYLIYGQVTQADSVIGNEAIRADVGGKRQYPTYGFVEYPTNAILSASESKLKEIVEDDLFMADVTIVGVYTYKTSIGGELTVPLLYINSIKMLGHV